MTDNDPPWEPPLAGTEAEQLTGALDRLRATFRWKADDLGAAGLQARIGASTLTLGGLLKHLALVEELYSGAKLTGAARRGMRSTGTPTPTGSSARPPTTPPGSSTHCGMRRPGGPGPTGGPAVRELTGRATRCIP
jgi:hypothetical protein